MLYMNLFRVALIALTMVFLSPATSYGQEAAVKTGDNLPEAPQPVVKPTVKPSVALPVTSDVVGRIRRTSKSLNQELETIRKNVNSPTATINSLVKSRGQLVVLRKKIARERGVLETPLADFKARLNEIGPVPKKGETEAKSITEQRAALSKVFDKLKAAQKKLDLLDLAAGQLATKTSTLQKKAFVKRVLVSRKSVVNPKLWWDFTPTLFDVGPRVVSVFEAWIKPAGSDGKISGIASMLAIMASFSLSLLLVAYIWGKMSHPPIRIGDATDLRRIWRAVGGTAVVAVIGIVSVSFGLIVLDLSAVEDIRISRVVVALGEIIFSTAVMVTVLRALLAPANSEWRLVNMADEPAHKLFWYGMLAALLFGVDRGALALADITFMPLEFVVGINAVVSIGLIFLIAKMVTISRGCEQLLDNIDLHSDRNFYFAWAHRFFLIIWAILVVAILALLLGYVALAHFILTNTLVTGALVIVLHLVHHLVDELVTSSTQPWSRIGKFIRGNLGFGDETIRRLGLLFSTITDFSVILIGAPIILALWTITWVDFSALATQAFFGFKIGDVFIQPAKIFLGIVIFIIGVLMVRVLSLWLQKRILERSNIDAGVQNSISTGVKYAGLLLAAGFSLTAAGLDFSKLAIVAGALSVGIGFGLQSVVSNFVSGLILLAERPIRIGDWIEVGAGEGVVQKINVRSTEILTFDRCSVIVPNSSFISDPVRNWSQGSSIGRIKVNIGVGYDSDPEQVKEILLKCAHAHDGIVDSPPSRVMFMDFGASSLDFQLRVFLKDIGDSISVASDLRFAIFRELKIAGVEIPFPQRDINIRDVDKLAEAFVRKPASRKAPRKAPRK